MNQEELRQALLELKAIIDNLTTKRNLGKSIREGALAGSLPVHAAFETDDLIDSSSAAELDAGADAWLALLPG